MFKMKQQTEPKANVYFVLLKPRPYYGIINNCDADDLMVILLEDASVSKTTKFTYILRLTIYLYTISPDWAALSSWICRGAKYAGNWAPFDIHHSAAECTAQCSRAGCTSDCTRSHAPSEIVGATYWTHHRSQQSDLPFCCWSPAFCSWKLFICVQNWWIVNGIKSDIL